MGRFEWWSVRELLKHLTPDHQLELLAAFVSRGIQDGWYFESVIKAIDSVQLPVTRKMPLLTLVREQLYGRPYGSPKNKGQLIDSLNAVLGDPVVQ